MSNNFLDKLGQMIDATEIVISEMENSEMSAALVVLNWKGVYSLSKLDEKDRCQYLLEITRDVGFREEFEKHYCNAELDPSRLPLLKECFSLHAAGRYYGAVPLMYSQIEGILTEALLRVRSLREEGWKYIEQQNGMDKLNKNQEPVSIRGLSDKFRLSKEINPDVESFFLKMSSIELVFGDASSHLSATRNDVLHGKDLLYGIDGKRSTQLALWLFGLVIMLSWVEFID